MIIIFDTYSGLCNQFYDILCGINFCIINNIKFTFRYCAFRNKNLVSFYMKDFNTLFDTRFLEKYSDLYVKFDSFTFLNNENTFNLSSERSIDLFTDNFLHEIKGIDKEFIILKQFFPLYKFSIIVDDFYSQLKPCDRLMNIYKNMKNKIIINNEKYNFLHYRYENDFTNYFKVEVEDLYSILLNVKSKFKNPNLKIYIATSSIKSLIKNNHELNEIILMKNEDDDDLLNLNYEELAFIDYMFGLESEEVFGHSKSSFSHMQNHLKRTCNFYT